MPTTTTSTNMSLPVPVVGQDTGPQYGTDINTCLTLIDSHDHSSGAGVQITPSGININSDLSFGGNNATTFRSVRFSTQSAALAGASDLGCLYEVGVDLYYNDGSGNQVRITQSGGVAGSPGSISSLSSPASASYVSANSTFVWQSAANTSANLDCASVILRNLTASSNGITLSAPGSLGSNYTVTLPALPGSTKFLSIDSSGNMGATWAVDSSTLEISSNTLQVKSAGITSTQLASNSVNTTQIVNQSVTTAKINGGAVTASEIASNAVTTSKIIDGAVTFAKLDGSTLVSGQYSASGSASTNVSATTFSTSQYIRIGNRVMVAGTVALTFTSSGIASEVFITLPVASNITSSNDLLGSGWGGAGTNVTGLTAFGDASGDRASVRMIAPNAGVSCQFYYTFMYLVA